VVSLARRRAAAQLLDGAGGRTAGEVVAHLLAVQAQDPRSWPLALGARGARRGGADPAAAIAAAAGAPGADGAAGAAAPDGSTFAAEGLVLAWLLRGTLHVVADDDLPWLFALCGRLTERTSMRRLAQLGVDPAATAEVLRALDGGPLTRSELAAALDAAGVRSDGQRTPHLVALAAARGQLLPGLDGRYRRVTPPPPVDREAAMAELARRYLRGHGPATDRDLAAWSGLPLRDARSGLAAIAGELAEDRDGLVDLAGRPAAPRRPLPEVLLPAFDPYLLGWRERSFAVPPAHAPSVHPGGGVIRATIVADGVVTGTWRRDRGRVLREPF